MKQALLFSLLIFLLAPVAGFLLIESGVWLVGLVILWYWVASLTAFARVWQDKRRAEREEWRVPEKELHFIELIGGWPGAVGGYLVFRHKTKKLSFKLITASIILLHGIFWIGFFYLMA